MAGIQMQFGGMTLSTGLMIRPATIADRDGLGAFLTKVARDENIDAFDVLGYLQDVAIPMAQIQAGQILVAVQPTGIVGLASLVFRHDGDVEIDGLLIDPAEGRDKIGPRLIERCKEFARSANVRTIYTTAKEEVEPVLAAWGFATIGIDEGMLGSVALKMQTPV